MSLSLELAMISDFGCERLKRSEEHTSELQSHVNLVCRLLLEKKKPPPPPSSATPSACCGPTSRCCGPSLAPPAGSACCPLSLALGRRAVECGLAVEGWRGGAG